MKNITIGIGSFIIILLLILILYTMQGRGAREEEIKDAITNAMESAGEQMKENGAYGTDQELEAAFVENLMQQLDSVSDTSVTILKADHEKGLLSAEVTQTYQHPNGKTGKVSCVRTVILDRQDEVLRQKSKQHTVRFYYGKDTEEKECYKTITLWDGEDLSSIKDPQDKEGRTFAGWVEEKTDQKVIFPVKIVEDKVYYATWR